MTGINEISGLSVGHAQDREARTGCTVVLCRGDFIGGADVRGGAPGTRETDLLEPEAMMERVDAVLLTGGSAFGLAAADGVMRYLEEKGIGYDTGTAKVPIVPAAVLYDLDTGLGKVRPGRKMGYQACEQAEDSQGFAVGVQGAGTGATVGKIKGMEAAANSGIGTACIKSGELKVGALVVTNAFGDVVNPDTGDIIAGARDESGKYINSEKILMAEDQSAREFGGRNTTLGVVATNARLTKAEVNKVASMAHDGLARVICPVHTMFDGDTIFSLARGEIDADVNRIGTMAVEAVARAVIYGVEAVRQK
ncbi:MAG: P1 family peptidase [Halanaerobiales bacterium]